MTDNLKENPDAPCPITLSTLKEHKHMLASVAYSATHTTGKPDNIGHNQGHLFQGWRIFRRKRKIIPPHIPPGEGLPVTEGTN
jgi:hypothetical protein